MYFVLGDKELESWFEVYCNIQNRISFINISIVLYVVFYEVSYFIGDGELL